MAFPAPQTAAFCAFAGYAATMYLEPQWSTFAFAAYFASGFTVAFLSWVAWTVVLYPKFFSPLRGLPEPQNVSWKQIGELQLLPNGAALMEW